VTTYDEEVVVLHFHKAIIEDDDVALFRYATRVVLMQEDLVPKEKHLLEINASGTMVNVSVRGPHIRQDIVDRVLHHPDGFCIRVHDVRYCATLEPLPEDIAMSRRASGSGGTTRIALIVGAVLACIAVVFAVVVVMRVQKRSSKAALAPADAGIERFVNPSVANSGTKDLEQQLHMVAEKQLAGAGAGCDALAQHKWSHSPKSGLSWDYGKVHDMSLEETGSAESPPRIVPGPQGEQSVVIRSLDFDGEGNPQTVEISDTLSNSSTASSSGSGADSASSDRRMTEC